MVCSDHCSVIGDFGYRDEESSRQKPTLRFSTLYYDIQTLQDKELDGWIKRSTK